MARRRRKWLAQLLHPPDLDAPLAELLSQIPPGRVTTYGDLARHLGLPAASRWVGEWMVGHRHGEGCPCHRVVRSDGRPGLYIERDSSRKVARLVDEGIELVGGRVDLVRFRFTDFHGPRPLVDLVELQREMAAAVRLEPVEPDPPGLAGVDVSFGTSGTATAAYVWVPRGDERCSAVYVHRGPVAFPYIQSLLSFRELPLLIRLIEVVVQQCGELPGPIVVDGSGILHPRRSGLATLLGLALDWPTIGVTKSRLVGSYDAKRLAVGAPQPVLVDQQPLGWAILPGSGTHRPLFVSPGHRVDVPSCRGLIEGVLGSRRLPLPIYWADRISRQHAKGVEK